MSEPWPKLRASFLTGLLVVLPLAGTILLVVGLFFWSTDWLLPASLQEQGQGMFTDRMTALVLFVVLVMLTGWLMTRLAGKQLLTWVESVISRIPILNATYGFMRQFGDVMAVGENSVFQRVVLVQYPRRGLFTLAFATKVTGGEVAARSGKTLVSIFLPTPPNPTTGYLALFPQDEVIALDMSVTDAMKMSFSGGAVVPLYPPAPPRRMKTR